MTVKLTDLEKALFEMAARSESTYEFLKRIHRELKGYDMAGHVLIHLRNEFEGRKEVPKFVHDYFALMDKEPTRLPPPEFRSIIRI